jgi:DNA-binding LytR/AlgR family response regulator
MEKTTCILIGQNEKDVEKLITLLNEINSVEVVGAADNTKDGLLLVNDLEPNLLFLAVKADDLTSFKFLEKIKKQPTIVFLVNDEASIKTFQTNQLRYLKKPFKSDDVKQLLMDFQKTHQQLGTKMQGLLGKLKFED